MMISIVENRCPMCQENDNSKITGESVMECSGQRFRICNRCSTPFVDTFLLDHVSKEGKNLYSERKNYKLKELALEFDTGNPNDPSDYYQLKNTYLFENDGHFFFRSWLFADDILASNNGLLIIINLSLKQIHFQNNEWESIETNNRKLGDIK